MGRGCPPIVVLLAVAFVGCASLSSLQTADTAPPGQARFAAGIGARSNVDVVTPQLTMQWRYGVRDNADLGFTIGSSGLLLDGKYRLVDRPRFKLALRAGLGGLPPVLGGATFAYADPGAILTIRFGEKSMSFAPSGLLWARTVEYRLGAGTASHSDLGWAAGGSATFGLRVDGWITPMVEVGAYRLGTPTAAMLGPYITTPARRGDIVGSFLVGVAFGRD